MTHLFNLEYGQDKLFKLIKYVEYGKIVLLKLFLCLSALHWFQTIQKHFVYK